VYNELKNATISEQVEKLTKCLVETLSVNGTNGEEEIANKIENILRSFPYFEENPNQVWIQYLPGDRLKRKNVFARIKGKEDSKKTIVFHSHIDTVGINDYGELKTIANNPEKLLDFFKGWEANKEIQEQAQSGDWMFGRGSLDMKSGVAVHLVNLLFFIENRERWSGEIIFMANPVEENQHTGVITAVDELLRLRTEENLEYIAAFNNDYIAPLYPGDTTKYIYTGAGGKLLPCFYVYGRETHVGQTLTGLDPTSITSELNRLINNNMELTEQVEGEMVIPPSTLYQRDTKDFYNVQTATTSYLYFNFMIYESSPKEVLEKLKKISITAATNVKKQYQKQYNLFSKKNNLPLSSCSWDMEVYSFEEYCDKLLKQGIEVSNETTKIVANNSNMEPRMLCYEIVNRLRELDQQVQPCIILFYAPPYCPHNYLKGNCERDDLVLKAVEEVINEEDHLRKENFEIKKFFPFLTDSSYLSLHDTDEEISSLISNFPEWEKIYNVPVHKIRELNIPALNIGVYGVDAHRWTERVYKPYSFKTVPLLIRKMTLKTLKS
jgi:arginine utilization protein RocB